MAIGFRSAFKLKKKNNSKAVRLACWAPAWHIDHSVLWALLHELTFVMSHFGGQEGHSLGHMARSSTKATQFFRPKLV